MLDWIRAWLFPSACAACDAPGPAFCARCAPTLSRRDRLRGRRRPGVRARPVRRRAAASRGRDEAGRTRPARGVRGPARRPRAADRRDRPAADVARARRGPRVRSEPRARAARRACEPAFRGAAVLEKRGGAQAGLGRRARLAAAGRFRLRRDAVLPSRATVLDDVTTTGATMSDALAVLRSAGVNVRRVVVVARTPG